MAKTKKYTIKDTSSNKLINTLLITLNATAYFIAILFSFFTPEFNADFLLPHWEVFNKTGELFGFMAVGTISVVPAGTPGAYFSLGVLTISAIVQIIGYLLYLNILAMKALDYATEDQYYTNVKVISKYKYLITDEKFRQKIYQVDLTNKKEAWLLLAVNRLQDFVDKIPDKVDREQYLPPNQHSKKTRRWLETLKVYKAQLTEDWIAENLPKVKIKYPRLNVRLIINSVDNLGVSRLAIEDVKAVKKRELVNKAAFLVLSLAFVTLMVSIGFTRFRSDIWNLVKDFVVYTSSLILNIILGIISAKIIHESNVRASDDRIGHIEGYVGRDSINQAFSEVTKAFSAEQRIEEMKQQLSELKSKVETEN